jgi:hypothetical protein
MRSGNQLFSLRWTEVRLSLCENLRVLQLHYVIGENRFILIIGQHTQTAYLLTL